jgi:hypothetical protein
MSMVIARSTKVLQGRGLPLPSAILHTTTFYLGVLFPRVYSREVRRPYTGAELRELRKLKGVGPVRRMRRVAR